MVVSSLAWCAAASAVCGHLGWPGTRHPRSVLASGWRAAEGDMKTCPPCSSCHKPLPRPAHPTQGSSPIDSQDTSPLHRALPRALFSFLVLMGSKSMKCPRRNSLGERGGCSHGRQGVPGPGWQHWLAHLPGWSRWALPTSGHL